MFYLKNLEKWNPMQEERILKDIGGNLVNNKQNICLWSDWLNLETLS